MNEFFTIEIAQDNGDMFPLSLRRSKVILLSRTAKTIAIAVEGASPITINLDTYEEAKSLYRQIAEELSLQ